jgi:hypothetical protein
VDQGRSTSESPELEGDDIAGLIMQDDPDHYGGLNPEPTLDIEAGGTITYVNYQDAPSGTSRQADQRGKYGQPAAFTGTYLGKQGTKMVAVVGGGTSFGSIDDKITRPGSSGGAVFMNNKKASFVGISTETSTFAVSSRDIKESFGVTVDVPDNSHLSYIEQVTPDIARSLYQGALSQPDCTTTGQQ